MCEDDLVEGQVHDRLDTELNGRRYDSEKALGYRRRIVKLVSSYEFSSHNI
jgi:hypothetical protein